ncbi:hypothetical protein B0J18DRAFT_420727 [Chaetomium sp. MPI-SDFR-AT-0129]|nr:hypothetical protein B0J18DRAFT_420727 [Chaetomium sp. MPI-SDFR-AT-0129]
MFLTCIWLLTARSLLCICNLSDRPKGTALLPVCVGVDDGFVRNADLRKGTIIRPSIVYMKAERGRGPMFGKNMTGSSML